MPVARAAPEELGLLYLRAVLRSSATTAQELQDTKDELKAMQSQTGAMEVARATMRERFAKQFIADNGNGDARLDHFSELEEIVQPWGADDMELWKLLDTSGPPGAWQQPGLRSYLKRKLGAHVSLTVAQAALQPNDKHPATSLAREAFVLDVCPSEWHEAIIRLFHAGLWETTPASGMEARLAEAKAIQGMEAFTKVAAKETALMGDRLFAMEVTQWPLTQSVLEGLIKESSHKPSEWHKKIVAALHQPTLSTPEIPKTLNRITALQVSAKVAIEQFDCLEDSVWLASLHQYESMQTAYKLSGGAGEVTAMISHLGGLVKDAVEFKRFYDVLKGFYYKDKTHKQPERVFTDILRPHARSDQTQAILSDALGGAFLVEHRAKLGEDLLGAHEKELFAAEKLAKPTWSGSPARVEHATALYLKLWSSGSAQAELDRPLLARIMKSLLSLFRSREQGKMDLAKKVLQTLSPHLLKLKNQRGDLTKSTALKALDEEVLRMLREARDALRGLAQDAASPVIEAQAQDYVASLKLALEFHALLSKIADELPVWLNESADDLRTQVFQLPEQLEADAVLYWEAAETRLRARILLSLDAPLRGALKESRLLVRGGPLFWQSIYLPLLRVHGITTLLGDATPHEQWIEAFGEVKSLQTTALAEALGSLAVLRYLDADALLLRLARLRMKLLLPGKSAWQVPPEELFGPAWKGVNANVRLLRVLLAEAQPAPQDSSLQLQAITRLVLADLEHKVPVNGPHFPHGGHSVAETRDPLNVHLAFAENLVVTNEWRTSPLKTNGVSVAWTTLVKSLPKAAPLPFAFTLPALAESRVQVDGTQRLQLTRLWLSARRPAEAAHAAMYLPNHAENNATPAGLSECLAMRQTCYTALNQQWQQPDISTLRLMLRLALSARAPLTPDIDAVMNSAPGLLPPGQRTVDELIDLKNERVEIEQLLRQTKGDVKARARDLIDHCPAVEVPAEWTRALKAGRGELIAAQFPERLRAMSDMGMKQLLKLRSHLRVLGGWIEGKKETSISAQDGARVARVLSYQNYVLWYERNDFSASEYVFGMPKMEGSKDQWYPALAMFAVADASAISSAIAATEGELRESLVLQSILLDDAAWRLVIGVSEHPDAQAMLAFNHTIRWTTCDFRLLYEHEFEECADAKSLTRQALQGVLRNFDLTGEDLSRKPDDKRVYARLFERMDDALPVEFRRNHLLKIQVTLDGAIARAAEWLEGGEKVAPMLKEGAQEFLSAGGTERRLLRGAATLSQGVLNALETLATKRFAQVPFKSYQDFYLNLLFDRGVPRKVSVGLYQDLAEPLLRGSEVTQRQEFTELIRRSEKLLHDPAVRETSFGKAWLPALIHALAPLVNGWRDLAGKAQATEFIWKPAKEFDALSGQQNAEPAAFLDLVEWWSQFSNVVQTPELREQFEVVDPKPEEEKAKP